LGLNDLPVQIIERIEIYKGAVPAYLGGDGLGSAVNVIFKHREVSYIDASVSRQSYNTQLSNLIVKKSFDKQGIEVGVGVFDTRSDNNYVMNSPYQPGLKIKRDHDKYHSLLAAGAIKFHKLWFDEIELEGAYVGNRKEIQGIQQNIQHAQTKGKSYVGLINLTRKNFAGDKLGLKYNLLLAKFDVKFIDTSAYSYDWDGNRMPSSIGRGELGNGPNLSTNLQRDLRQRFNLDYRLNPTFTLNLNNTFRRVSSDPEDNVGNAFLGKNAYNYPGSLLNSITGLTLESRFDDQRLLVSAAVKNYYNVVDGFNTSIYLNNSIPDKLRNVANEFGYTAGLRYSVSTSLLAKASFEKGLRLPNNTELFGDGVLITPTTTLMPETAHNYNIGLVFDQTDQQERRLQIEANAFYMNVENLIQLSGNGLTLGYVNYAKVNIKGADLDLKYDVTKNIFASFNATYQILTDINRLIPATSVPNPSYNLQIPNTPKLFFNWNAEYHRLGLLGPGSKTRLMYDGSYVEQYSYGFKISVYDNFVIPSYLTHTLSVEQSLGEGKYTVTAEANNITGKEVINNFNQPLPGRTFRIKLRMLLMDKDSHDHLH
jgi:outer membrane receptor protein involved in Fe transport